MTRLALFASHRVLVEGPAARMALAVAACLVMAPAAAAPAGPVADYGAAVGMVQAGLDSWLGKGHAFVVDRSKPRDAEIARLSKALGPSFRESLSYPGSLEYASVLKRKGICLVVGPDPSLTPSDVFSVAGKAKADPGNIGYRDAHVYGLWQGAAMCGTDKVPAAAAVAVLMAARDTASRDLPGLAGAAADLSDWVEPSENGATSGPAAEAAAAIAVKLRARGKLATTPYRELGRMGIAVGERQPTLLSLAPGYRGVLKVGELKAWYAPVREGAVSVDWRGWLRQSAIPQARHYGALLDYVEGSRRSPAPLPPMLADTTRSPLGSGNYAAADARLGDSGAAAYIDPKFVTDLEESYPEKRVPPKALPSWDDVPGVRIPFDRKAESLVPTGDATSFEIRDAATGRADAHGTAEHGIEPDAPRP